MSYLNSQGPQDYAMRAEMSAARMEHEQALTARMGQLQVNELSEPCEAAGGVR